jgi:AraC family transcriptional regulator
MERRARGVFLGLIKALQGWIHFATSNALAGRAAGGIDMFNLAKQLQMQPMEAGQRTILASAAERSAVARTHGAGDRPTAIVCRRSNGEVSEPVRTPGDAVALRFFLGRCQLCVHVGSQWHHCGEAVDGIVHASRPNQWVRTEWFSEGEELILSVPHTYWRERVTDRMRAILAQDKPRRHADLVLQQLVNILVQSALEGMHTAFAAPLIDAVLERIVALCPTSKHLPPQTPRRNALPAFRLERVVRYVREHIAEPITLQNMADAAGMSPMHFAALFRTATGQRPHHYLLEQRVLHAKELMARTSSSLCDIAISAGFNTQAHFSTVFKQFAGMTPRQWRVHHLS